MVVDGRARRPGEPPQPELVIGRRIRRAAAKHLGCDTRGDAHRCGGRALLSGTLSRDQPKRDQRDEEDDGDQD
jgi:hypothetical protein